MRYPLEIPLAALTFLAAATAAAGDYGYLDYTGKVVIEPQFTSAEPFVEGRAVVSKNRKWHLIDPQGKVLRGGFHLSWNFSGGRLAVEWREDGPWGYLNRDGKVPIGFKWAAAGDFSEGLAAVSDGSAYGYIDTAGKWVIPPRFKAAGPFSEGLAHVLGDKPPARFIDREGKEVIRAAGYEAKSRPFKNGFACLDKSSFMDRTGRRLPHPPLSDCWDFEGGYASVTFKDTAAAGGTHGLIDTAGRVVFKGRYRNMGPFRSGLTPVVVGTDACHYLDSTGTPRIQGPAGEPFMNCGHFRYGHAVVQPYRKDYGLIDSTGRFVLPPQYQSLTLGEGLLAFKRGDGVSVLNSEKTGTIAGLLAEKGITAGLPGAAGKEGTGSGRYVAWKLIRPGTATGGGSRMLEYAEVTMKSAKSFSEVEAAVGWRTRMGWIQENVGLESLDGGKDPKVEALRGAFGPGYNSVKNVQERSMGSFDL